MTKEQADKVILEYTGKIYGFALGHTFGIDAAEELAARIMLEVYATLLQRESITALPTYIYRIAQNVCARHNAEGIRNGHLSTDDMDIPSDTDFTLEVEKSETYALLRREIAYLSATQRNIVVAHYYGRQKLDEIAGAMKLPVGTVKWHLHEAKNSLKEGITKMRETGTLGINPIQLTGMGHSGNPAGDKDTAYYLKKRLTQNIAYAAYHTPRTVNEIAQELGVSPVFVEDEVATLEEYGFMDKLPGGKYRTNVYITTPSREKDEKLHLIYNKYSQIVRNTYIPLAIDAIRSFDRTTLYVPGNDENLLLWSALPFAMGKIDSGGISSEPYSVKRKDGSDYIASATLRTEELGGINCNLDNKYGVCGDMTRGGGKYPLAAWQINTYYDKRPGAWMNNLYTDYEYLYEFMTGVLTKEPAQIEKYTRLYEKGYLLQREDTDEINIIIARENNTGNIYESALRQAMPSITPELADLGKTMDEEVYAINREGYPEHMQGLCRAWSSNSIGHYSIRMRVMEQLLDAGVITLPAPERLAGLTTLMFADRLPEYHIDP